VTRSEKDRDKRAHARANGLCTTCWRRKSLKGARRCSLCRERNIQRLRRYRATAVAIGMCLVCRCRVATEGLRCCDRCSNWKPRRVMPWCNECCSIGQHRSECTTGGA
jgi:hypothetical protein